MGELTKTGGSAKGLVGLSSISGPVVMVVKNAF
jgi:hypothetical protein